jgi:hypothetical protein
VALTEFVITIESHAEPAMLEEIAGSLVHDLIRVNVFDSCCRNGRSEPGSKQGTPALKVRYDPVDNPYRVGRSPETFEPYVSTNGRRSIHHIRGFS